MCKDLKNCSCPHTQDAEPLKLEVGKTYEFWGAQDYVIQKVRIIGHDGKWLVGVRNDAPGNYFSYTGDGKPYGWGPAFALIREYIEPVVHTREVIWYNNVSLSPASGPHCVMKDGAELARFIRQAYIRILKRETVTYTEK